MSNVHYFTLPRTRKEEMLALGTFAFGAATIDVHKFVSIGYEGGDPIALYVGHNESFDATSPGPTQKAFDSLKAMTAIDVGCLLRYVLEGRINYATYCAELRRLIDGQPAG